MIYPSIRLSVLSPSIQQSIYTLTGSSIHLPSYLFIHCVYLPFTHFFIHPFSLLFPYSSIYLSSVYSFIPSVTHPCLHLFTHQGPLSDDPSTLMSPPQEPSLVPFLK